MEATQNGYRKCQMGSEMLEEVGPKKLLLQSSAVNGRWSKWEETAGNCFPAFCCSVRPPSLILDSGPAPTDPAATGSTAPS
jgi:hypothetical protein